MTVNVAAVRQSARTDSAGRFVLQGLPPGRHHLNAVLIGYARAETEVTVPESGTGRVKTRC